MTDSRPARRRVLAAGGSAIACLALPAIAWSRGLPAMTDGPFYPSLSYRTRWSL
jgi:hypothetical protein